MGRRFVAAASLAVCAALSSGCSTVRASGVATGPVRMPARSGPVAVYAAGYPVGGVDLGVVQVHASQSEATVDTLLPAFVKKVAELGGNAAVVERVEARFDVSTHMHVESYTYPCGFYTCVGTRSYPVSGEVLTLVMRGRAVNVPAGVPESTVERGPPRSGAGAATSPETKANEANEANEKGGAP